MNPLPFRIKIGVTGTIHDIPDPALLKERIRILLGMEAWNKQLGLSHTIFSFFDRQNIKLLRSAKNTKPAFSIMTSLAEGSDQLVAEAILEIPGSKIEVILPLRKSDYLRNKSVDSIQRFENLYQQDPFPVTLSNKSIYEGQWNEVQLKHIRAKAYYNAGRYIVDQCDVIIAVWDQEKAPGKGGTYDAIEYAKSVGRPMLVLNSKNLKAFPERYGRCIDASAIQHIDHLNSYQLSDSKKIAQEKEELDTCFDEEKYPILKSLQPGQLIHLKNILETYFVKTSYIANRFKSRFSWTGQLAYLLSTSAVIILLSSIIFHVLEQVAFIIEFILLSTIFGLIYRAHHHKVHSRWLEYRFLAERLRAIPYFYLAQQEIIGAKAPSNSDARVKRGQWTIMIFAEIWYQLYSADHNTNQLNISSFNPELKKYIQSSWIKGQLTFQNNYFKTNDRLNTLLEVGGRIIFATAILCALTHLLLTYYLPHSSPITLQILTLLSLALPTVAAVLEGVRKQGEYSRNKNRSDGMIQSLETLNQKFNHVEEEDFNALLREADIIMLSETKEWMMLMIPAELDYIC